MARLKLAIKHDTRRKRGSVPAGERGQAEHDKSDRRRRDERVGDMGERLEQRMLMRRRQRMRDERQRPVEPLIARRHRKRGERQAGQPFSSRS